MCPGFNKTTSRRRSAKVTHNYNSVLGVLYHIIFLESLIPSESTTEVKQLLHQLLQNDKHFRCNHTTPYGYQIDFVIHFDRDKNPIPAPPVEATMLDRITK